ncbi:MAG TPA: hypothetical protein VFL83_20295 [Anaeromyxobacter sp.]|nr:hypothetical protein [Anaeromyxobacter sp.]
MGGTEGGSRRGPAIRMWEALAEAWRERSTERRALAAPKVAPEPRLPRSRLVAAFEARAAVRAGVRLEDFLRSRLAKYASRLPVPLEELPVTIEISGGEAVVRSKAPPRSFGPRPPAADAPAPARALVARDGPAAAREIDDAELALEALHARAAALRARVEAESRAFADALAAGTVAPRPDLEATPEQLGRPPVPSPGPIWALRGFVAALAAAEAWRLSGPVLALAGIDAAGVDEALLLSPLRAGFALAFAAGAAAAVLAFAGVALARAADALDDAPAPRRTALGALAAAASAASAGGIAVAASSGAPWGHAVLLVAVPFTAALLYRWSSALARRRAGALDAALAWDRDRAREALERGRRVEALAAAQEELRAVEAERAVARRRVARLQRRAIEAERHALLAARADTRRLERLAEGLAGALELDRYLFVRLAAERDHAVARPVRAGRLEPAVAGERLGIAS